jgi:hypothetical protein
LPPAPTKRRRHAAVASHGVRWPADMSARAVKDSVGDTVGAAKKSVNIPSRKPRSPTRLTTNAFLPAIAFCSSVYQNPMSRYEQRPTPSQPTKSSGRLSPRTRTSIIAAKRFRYAK